MNPFFYSICGIAGRSLAGALADVRVSGRENVPPVGPVILVANHLNNVDPVLLASFLPRPVHFLTKVELWQVELIGTWASWYGAIPIRRGEIDRGAIESCLDVLRSGGIVGVFPEGTRSRVGSLRQPKPGLSLLAGRSGAPILPVAIWGTERVRGLPVLWEHPRIEIRIGQPVRIPTPGGRHRHQAFTDAVMIEIARRLPPAYRGVYADRVAGDQPAEPA